MYKPAPHEYRELQLYIDNDYQLYRQKQAIEENLRKKCAKGKYDHTKAPKLWQYMVDEGARKYAKEFGGTVRMMFPKPLRAALAKEYADDWRDENKKCIEEGRKFARKKKSTKKKSTKKKSTKKKSSAKKSVSLEEQIKIANKALK
jgi:post-segregation antitoxin (ccd killing protein)